MKRLFQTRLFAVLLAVLTLAAIGLAIGNFMQENDYQAPTDGVAWTEVAGGLQAYRVPSDTPGYLAGLRKGDVLTAVNGTRTPDVAALERALPGVWQHATYTILRSTSRSAHATPLDVNVILKEADKTDNQVLRLIALFYLAIGVYILLRRWTAPQATHFFVFSLASFVLYSFKYTGVLDGLDFTILVGNYLAIAVQPALFLHFALSFSGIRKRLTLWRALYTLLYLPAAVLLCLRWTSLFYWRPTARLQHKLDQVEFSYLAVYYLLAATIFYIRYRTTDQPLPRQQLKWLSRGTLLAVVPFTALYVIPFLADLTVPGALIKVALLSLLLLPLTFSWAIVRFRLMDVDLILKRGVSYTLATAALVGIYFGIVALAAEVIHKRWQHSGEWGLVAAVIVTGFVFDPLKRAIQARVDRVFDPRRIDYREALIEFGRRLNAETDPQALVTSLVERLHQTLLVTRVAVFQAEEPYSVRQPRFSLIASHGLSKELNSDALDLGFLSFRSFDQENHLFFETPDNMLRLPDSQRATAAALDLNYYVPCRAASHAGGGQTTVAVLGLGRTSSGDFLSSEDMEVLETLARYIGIAMQNAQLYSRLEQKILDFEKLRDFNENIVESINVGVFALDLENRLESWNAQMEVLQGKPRAAVLRRPAREVFSSEFNAELERLEGQHSVHTLYKHKLALPGGESRTVNVTMAPLLNRELETVGRIVIIDDISARVSMEAQLTQADKLSSIGLLAAGVAHEVNTPLAVISSYTQMLGKQIRMDEAAQARLGPVIEKITQQTFRASEIVNGLLNFSRMSTVDFAQVDLNQIAMETLQLLEHQLRRSGVTIETDFEPALPLIAGNRGKLQQVLVNLVLNARDALVECPKPVITLSTHQTGTEVELHVSDNGSGIAPEVLRKIYDPFFTTKLQPKDGQRKGTGLGLAVSYGIIQEHGGRIDASSTVGHGTTFQLVFPFAGEVIAPALAGVGSGDAHSAESNHRGNVVHA